MRPRVLVIRGRFCRGDSPPARRVAASPGDREHHSLIAPHPKTPRETGADILPDRARLVYLIKELGSASRNQAFTGYFRILCDFQV